MSNLTETAENPAARDSGVQPEVEKLLMQRLLDDGPLALVPNIALALVLGVLIWDNERPAIGATWATSIIAAVFIRARLIHRAARLSDTKDALGILRAGVLLVALAWGVGALLLAPHLELADLVLVLVMFCGLVAGATNTMLPDPLSFRIFLAGLLIPISVGVARNGETPSHQMAVLLVALYAGTMFVLHRRAHLALVDHFRAATLLKIAEREATRERTIIDALVNGAPNAIAVVRRDWKVIRTNAAFEKLFGYTEAEILDRTLVEVVVPESGKAISLDLGERMWAGETVTEELARRRKDGTAVTVRMSAAAIDVGDEVLAFVTYEDITEAVRARNHMRESERRLFQVLDSMPVGVFVVNHEAQPLFANSRAKGYLGQGIIPGLSVGELAERYGAVLAGTDQAYPTERMPVLRALSGESVTIEDMDVVRPDGGRRSLEVIGSPIRDSDGKVIYGVAVFTDVTERRAAARQLLEAEERYRQLVESASDMVWKLDAEGRFTFANRAAEKIYGWQPQQLIGRKFLDFSDPEHLERDRTMFEAVFGGTDVRNHETVHRDAHDNPRRLSTSAHPVWDAAGGRVVAVHGIARDVTEQVAAREALRAARDAAEKATAAKSAFLANMSHEIRTPMNGVLGMVELLLDTDLSPEQRRSVELVGESGEALMSIINDILDFSKIEAGQLDIENVEFDLPALLDSAARLQMSRSHQRGLELVCDVPADVPQRVVGDGNRIRQVINNLLGNAIKFTHAGEVVVSVTQETRVNGKARLRFAVRDTGIGIPLEHQAVIFEPFKQADISTSRRYGGTGLGLSISRRLVELMGGKIELKSQPGAGSEFSFVLEFPVVSAERTVPPDLRSVQGLRVLVVDDHATNRRVLSEMISWGGCDVAEARDAVEALDMLGRAASQKRAYQLVVSDVHMPVRDGFDLAQTIRADPGLSSTPIILLTSGGAKGDGQRCRELGIGGYLLKPVSRAELLQAVAAAVDGPMVRGSGMHRASRTADEGERKPLHILLAEDNQVNQEVASAMLRKRGHSVDIAGNGIEAVEAVRKARYDVVLMDLQMPEMDGFQATSAIRGLTADRPLPIIAVTANALSGERERCLAAGMDDYLAKPFKPHDLFAVVEGWGKATGEPGGGSVPSPVSDAPPVDLAGLRDEMRAAGIEEIVDELIRTFLHDATGRMTALREAVVAGDARGIERAAHAYKSAAATIHAAALAALLKETELTAKEGAVDKTGALVARVGALHDAVVGYLQADKRISG